MWTETTREDYRRDDLTYASGTRDAEWAELVLLLPPPRRLGRRRKWELREIVDALLYIGWSGCPWRALPADFPPHSTVQRYF
jgi:putative transposase